MRAKIDFQNAKHSNSLSFLTAIKLLLTDPRPRPDELKCSITSQLDFFTGACVATVVPADDADTTVADGCPPPANEPLPPAQLFDGISMDVWAVRVWRSDADRRVIPVRRPTTSYMVRKRTVICNCKNIYPSFNVFVVIIRNLTSFAL